MEMVAMDFETKNDAILEAGSKATINDEVLTREEKLQNQADAAEYERSVGTWDTTDWSDIGLTRCSTGSLDSWLTSV